MQENDPFGVGTSVCALKCDRSMAVSVGVFRGQPSVPGPLLLVCCNTSLSKPRRICSLCLGVPTMHRCVLWCLLIEFAALVIRVVIGVGIVVSWSAPGAVSAYCIICVATCVCNGAWCCQCLLYLPHVLLHVYVK